MQQAATMQPSTWPSPLQVLMMRKSSGGPCGIGHSTRTSLCLRKSSAVSAFRSYYRVSLSLTKIGLADGHCRINVHLRGGASSRKVARASQSQVQDGVSAVIENCMRNRARPLGGAAKNYSELCITVTHELTNSSEMMMDISKPGF